MNMIKQSVGVDISKDDFIVYVELLFVDQTTKKLGGRKFANTPKGAKKFVEWLGKKSVADVPLQIVMEATGRYHEVLAYYLYENHYRVCVALPNRIKHFAHSLHQFSKTDTIDAYMIARYGSSRLLDTWQPSSPGMRRLRELTRERQDLIKMRTQAINRLGAMRVAAKPMVSIIERLEAQIDFFNQQMEDIDAEMDQLSREDQVFSQQLERLISIPNIGKVTARTILAETAGFVLFNNRSQLIKYAGLDVIERESGTSVHGRSRVSKRGNAHLRSALFMPALGAIRKPGIFRNVYQRHLAKHKNPNKALMAVQRKLLLVAFAIHQSGQMYDVNIHYQSTLNEVGEHNGSPTVARLAS
jgi:transposase